MRMEKSGSPEKVCDSPAIIIQQIDRQQDVLSVRRKCRATRHVQWSMLHPGPARYKALHSPLRALRSPFHEPEKPGFGNRKRLSGDRVRSPPLTLTRRSSHSSILPTESACAANTSFTLASIRSTSANCQPRSRQRRVAYTGTIPINAGILRQHWRMRVRASTGKLDAQCLASLHHHYRSCAIVYG